MREGCDLGFGRAYRDSHYCGHLVFFGETLNYRKFLDFKLTHYRFFYQFDLEAMVLRDHLLRGTARFLDLSNLRAHLAPFYSHTGRPSIDPELLIRMLIVGYRICGREDRRMLKRVDGGAQNAHEISFGRTVRQRREHRDP